MDSHYTRTEPTVPAGVVTTIVLDDFPDSSTYIDVILLDSEAEAWMRVDGPDPAVDGDNSIVIRKDHGQAAPEVNRHATRALIRGNDPDFPIKVLLTEASRVYVETRY